MVAARAHLYLGGGETCRLVRSSQQGTALILQVLLQGRLRTLVVKQHGPTPAQTTVRALFEIHETLRAQDPRCADLLPPILGYDEVLNFTVREYVAGVPLLVVLRRALLSRRLTNAERYLRMAADALSAINAHPAADSALPRKAKDNRTTLSSIAISLRTTGLSMDEFGSLPPEIERRLPTSFWDARGDRLLLCDTQPKNVIVANDLTLRFIDLGYLEGHPAMALAAFLVALDRLGLRTPSSRRLRVLESWKRIVVDTYRASPDADSVSGLVLYYPFILLQHLERHLAARPAFSAYLKHYYGKRLRHFAASLTDAPFFASTRSTPRR